jgi:enediyne biosynthesis protein E4
MSRVNGGHDFLARHGARLVAVLLVGALLALAQQPRVSRQERQELASRFRFTPMALPEPAGYPVRSVRSVNQDLERISAWISSVGAGVALADLDGDGLPNDLCHVDPRTDLVLIAPVPGTGARYSLFALNPAPLTFDTATMAPMGCLPGDINEDGLTDLIVYYWGRPPITYLRRTGSQLTGPEAFQPREILAPFERWYSNAATLADLDGDGHLDLLVGNYFPDESRVLDAGTSGTESMQDSMSRAFNGAGIRLLRWIGATAGPDPDVHFMEAQGIFDREVAGGWTLAVGAADLDGDLLPEIYVANDFGPDRLLHNRSSPGQFRFARLEGRRTFTTPASSVLGRDSFKGMGVDFGDLNGDGLLDVYVSNIATEFALLESHFAWLSTGGLQLMGRGRAPYVNGSEKLGLSRSGWGWDSKLADFDNDGVLEAIQATGFVRGEVNRWPELQELATGNDSLLRNHRVWPRFRPGDDLSGRHLDPFFVRSASGRYVDIAREIGLTDPFVSRGIAIGDVDGDGDLDFAVAVQWDRSWFFRNECPRCGSFLGLHLLLPLQGQEPGITRVQPGHPGAHLPGRPAIGAQATLRLPDGRLLVAQVDGGNGHSGKRSPQLFFGLGELGDDAAVPVELRWRDPGGQVRQETLLLRPGWQTVLLGGR